MKRVATSDRARDLDAPTLRRRRKETSVPEEAWKKRERAYQDWIRHGMRIEADELRQPHGARALELIECGRVRLAFNILYCPTMRCGDRWCPRCGVQRIEPHRKRIIPTARAMSRPVLALFKVYSKGRSTHALSDAYDVLRAGIRAVRRMPSLRMVKKAIGRIEAVPKVLGHVPVWHVHAHVILDTVGGAVDVSAVQRDFRAVTRRRNAEFGTQPIRSMNDVLGYITKARDVCPQPGALPVGELDQLIGAMRGKQLVIRWGLSHRGRRRFSWRIRVR